MALSFYEKIILKENGKYIPLSNKIKSLAICHLSIKRLQMKYQLVKTNNQATKKSRFPF